jgi:hypothetical protein
MKTRQNLRKGQLTPEPFIAGALVVVRCGGVMKWCCVVISLNQLCGWLLNALTNV